MYELVGILVGLIVINAVICLLMLYLLFRCYCLITEESYDIRKLF